MKKVNTRKALRAIACALVVSGAFVAALVALSVLFYPKDNSAEFGMHDEDAHGVLGEPDNTIDVLFLGDSECYCAFSPMQMWYEYGFTAYNCGTHAQHLHYGNRLLHDATQRQSPRVVVIETDTLFRKFSISNALFQMMEDTLPVFDYHNRWKTLVPQDFTAEFNNTRTTLFKGFVIRWAMKAAEDLDYMEDEDEEERLERMPRLNKAYLQSMIDYCRSIGAEPLLVSTPSTVNWNTTRHNAVQKFADEAGVTYIDLNEGDTKVEVDWSRDTSDNGDHMNIRGAYKVTAFIGAYLSENYDLPDHREDDAYAAWAELSEWYQTNYGSYR